MGTATTMALEEEIRFFEKNKARLLADHEGKFVVIEGERLLGAYDTVENAYNAGLQAFGDRQFLVRKVSSAEQNLTNLALLHGLINAHP
jgi:hypothetical protein